MKNRFKSRLFYVFLLVIMVVATLTCGTAVLLYTKYTTASEIGYINTRLMAQADDWNMIIDAYLSDVANQEHHARAMTDDLVTAQLKSAQELIRKDVDDNHGVLPEEVKQGILTRLARQTIGASGYVWILDDRARYILSKDRLRDGESIWDTRNAKGVYSVREMISQAKQLAVGSSSMHSYVWTNQSEKFPREKIAAFTYFKELGWTVGVSAYYDDMVDASMKSKSIEALKGMVASQKIGKTGYIWVIDSQGTYQVSKGRERDGENIINAKDNDGNFFIREAISQAKHGSSSVAMKPYPWKNVGESSARTKLAGLAYNKNLDWIIGVSDYYDDLDTTHQSSLLIELILAVFVLVSACALIVWRYVTSKTRSIAILVGTSRQIIDGNLDVELPDVVSGDEIEEIGAALGMLLGVIRNKREQ